MTFHNSNASRVPPPQQFVTPSPSYQDQSYYWQWPPLLNDHTARSAPPRHTQAVAQHSIHESQSASYQNVEPPIFVKQEPSLVAHLVGEPQENQQRQLSQILEDGSWSPSQHTVSTSDVVLMARSPASRTGDTLHRPNFRIYGGNDESDDDPRRDPRSLEARSMSLLQSSFDAEGAA
jgi:hypothetical protein